MQVREGLYYNPYFTGGAIAMPKMLADGGTEYDDGTIATESQQAKVRLPACSTAWGAVQCVPGQNRAQNPAAVLWIPLKHVASLCKLS